MTRGGRSGAAPAAPSIDTSGTAPPAIGTTKKKKTNPKTKHQKTPQPIKQNPSQELTSIKKKKQTNHKALRERSRPAATPGSEEPPPSGSAHRARLSSASVAAAPARLRLRCRRRRPARPRRQHRPRPAPRPSPARGRPPAPGRCGAVRPEEGSGRLGPGSRGRWVLCAAWFPRRLPEILLFRWFLDVSHHTCRHTCPSQRLAQCPTAAL